MQPNNSEPLANCYAAAFQNCSAVIKIINKKQEFKNDMRPKSRTLLGRIEKFLLFLLLFRIQIFIQAVDYSRCLCPGNSVKRSESVVIALNQAY